MKILVLNGSPAGKNSVTLQTVHYLEALNPAHTFETLQVGQQIRSFDRDFSAAEAALREADLILFCYPVYTFLAPSQLHRFIEIIKARGIDLRGKYATQLTTSKHFYDTTAHRYIEDNCADLGLRYIRGISADMDDLLKETGRKQAEDFFRFVVWSIETGCVETPVPFTEPKALALCDADIPAAVKTKPGQVVVVADLPGDNERLSNMISRFEKRLCRSVKVVNIADFPFSGGCLGCFHCASDGKCIYKDGFDSFLREQIQSAEATVYAFSVKDHSMGARFKMFDDRQFCNGHRTVTMGKPVGYLVDGDLTQEENLRMLMVSRAGVGGNFLAGVASDGADPEDEIDRMAQVLDYAIDHNYQPPADFLGVGGMKIFRDLIYQMQGLMRADHKFYKAHGFYKDFPQKHKGTIAAMYLVGGIMKNKAIAKKMGAKMTEFMVMPYQKAMEKAIKNHMRKS